MSFYHLPNPWNPGYAIPDYVMAEPPERGTFTTKWLPRGTISQVVPDFLAKPGKRLLGRDDADLGSLGADTLDASKMLAPQTAFTKKPPSAGGLPKWVLPVALGGVGLLIFMKMRKRGR